jgi:hypothetical protein
LQIEGQNAEIATLKKQLAQLVILIKKKLV